MRLAFHSSYQKSPHNLPTFYAKLSKPDRQRCSRINRKLTRSRHCLASSHLTWHIDAIHPANSYMRYESKDLASLKALQDLQWSCKVRDARWFLTAILQRSCASSYAVCHCSYKRRALNLRLGHERNLSDSNSPHLTLRAIFCTHWVAIPTPFPYWHISRVWSDITTRFLAECDVMNTEIRTSAWKTCLPHCR